MEQHPHTPTGETKRSRHVTERFLTALWLVLLGLFLVNAPAWAWNTPVKVSRRAEELAQKRIDRTQKNLSELMAQMNAVAAEINEATIKAASEESEEEFWQTVKRVERGTVKHIKTFRRWENVNNEGSSESYSRKSTAYHEMVNEDESDAMRVRVDADNIRVYNKRITKFKKSASKQEREVQRMVKQIARYQEQINFVKMKIRLHDNCRYCSTGNCMGADSTGKHRHWSKEPYKRRYVRVCHQMPPGPKFETGIDQAVSYLMKRLHGLYRNQHRVLNKLVDIQAELENNKLDLLATPQVELKREKKKRKKGKKAREEEEQEEELEERKGKDSPDEDDAQNEGKTDAIEVRKEHGEEFVDMTL